MQPANDTEQATYDDNRAATPAVAVTIAQTTVQKNNLWLAKSMGSVVTPKLMVSNTSSSYQRPDVPTGHGACEHGNSDSNDDATTEQYERRGQPTSWNQMHAHAWPILTTEAITMIHWCYTAMHGNAAPCKDPTTGPACCRSSLRPNSSHHASPSLAPAGPPSKRFREHPWES